MTPVVIKNGESQTFKATFKDVKGFRGFKDDVKPTQGVMKEFRWSDNGEDWSYWSELTKSNLKNITISEHSDIQLECKYTLNGGALTNAIVYDICIVPDYSENVIEIKDLNDFTPTTETTSSANTILDIASGSFNPYAINQAMNLYNQLSENVSNMFGLDSMYFRATPVDKSGDVIFKEWTLFNVSDPVSVKIMMNNNEMPDMNPQYSSFGMDFVPFEIEILKTEFQNKFGVDSIPQKGDIIYIPTIGMRLFEISSSTPNRGFMYQEVSWKCNLVKYKPKSNRDLSKASLETIDDLIESNIIPDRSVSDEELFNESLTKIEENITVPQVLNSHIGTTNDPVRSYVAPKLKNVPFNLDNHGVKVANYYYELASLFDKDMNIVLNDHSRKPEEFAVIYNRFNNFKKEQDFVFTSWFSFNDDLFDKNTLVKKIEKVDNLYKLTLDKLLDVKEGDYISVERQGRLSFYGKVRRAENFEVWIEIEDVMLEELEKISANWAAASGYVAKKTQPSTLLDGFGASVISTDIKVGDIVFIASLGVYGTVISIEDDEYCIRLEDGSKIKTTLDGIEKTVENAGVKLEAFNDRFLLFTHNQNKVLFSLKNKLDKNKWYALSLNFSNKFSQLLLSIFTINTDMNVRDSDLMSVFSGTQNIKKEDMLLDNYQFVLRPSNHKQTNIRIYKEAIPEDKLKVLLNQYVISDSNNAVLVDNAVPMNHLPYLGTIK